MNIENKKIRVVQFIHPGREHCPLKKDLKAGRNVYSWNYGGHRRKFMKVNGNYVDDTNQILQDELYFWGEWEPCSRFSPIVLANQTGDYPKYIHEPFYNNSPGAYSPCGEKGFRQNTDPFVFSGDFLYCLCKQDHYHKFLKGLAPGSLILFGSCKNPRSLSKQIQRTKRAYFALDTVFVVKEAIDYVPKDFRSTIGNIIPQNYDKIMGFDDWKDDKPKVFYRGVNFEEKNNYDGMYSFVPCRIGNIGKQGFERVPLFNEDISVIKTNVITDNLTQGLKCTDTDIVTNKKIWQKICDIVKQQNCYKGFNLKYN